MRCAASARPWFCSLVRPACSVASLAMRVDSDTCRLISAIELDSSSAAAAAVCTLADASSEAAATVCDCRLVSSAVADIDCAVDCNSDEADETVCTMPLTRSEEHTSELQSLMRISYAVFCLKKKKNKQT